MLSSPHAAGDNLWYEHWRERELSRVDRNGMTYLDYTGAALAPASLLHADFARLSSTVLGNPHSEHSASRASTDSVEHARSALLAWFHADPHEYTVVFTANASAACRLVGESFPFNDCSSFVLTQDNHNSVNGLREFARAKGAQTVVLPLDDELRLDAHATQLWLSDSANSQNGGLNAHGTRNTNRTNSTNSTNGANGASNVHSLFAFPAQSNFSGVRHPLSLIPLAQERGFRVLLDAAAFVPTASLRLDQVHPDFVVLSLYKMIGYPSGVGALIARREALAELRRPWFAGGTVDWVSIAGDRHQLRASVDRFEDGTPAFAAVGAVPHALQVLAQSDPVRLTRHLSSLTQSLLDQLQSLHHSNGMPIVRIHGPRTNQARGATVACTVHDRDGAVVPYWEVEERARILAVAIRGGCFCNPGCAEHAFAFPSAQTMSCLSTLGDDFSIPRFAKCLGDIPVGAIRISLGLGSVFADVERVVALFALYGDGNNSALGESHITEHALQFST